MGFWGFYFLAKLWLYFRGIFRLDFFLNLFFLFFLLLPNPGSLKNSKWFSNARLALTVLLGALLLWHDSWLPPLQETLGFVTQEGLPSKEYLFRFLYGFVSPKELGALFLIGVFWFAVRSRVRFAPVIFVLLLLVPLREWGHRDGGMNDYLEKFYRSEAARVVEFPKTAKENFDIIILHVCSLSWDDLRAVGLENDPFFKQFDYLFEDFNSVTGYSNPAAVRVLRSTCGQESHDALYADAPNGCYLLDRLRGLGYKTYAALNHDGKYYDFAEQARIMGHTDPPLFPSGLSAQAYNFDGSAIFDDYSVLERWFRLRQESKSPRAALYYNTISLHDGAHRNGDRDWWKRERKEQYREFAQKLFGDFTRFFERVASSGRNVVIVFVPEHGLALRGDTLQVAGLRDIPLPSITTVPVGIKLIGKGRKLGEQKILSGPSSYLSLSYLLAFFMDHRPFERGGLDPRALLSNLPETDFVSENQNFLVVEREGGYFLRGKDKKWVKLSTVRSEGHGEPAGTRGERGA